MERDIERVLVSTDEIAARVREMGNRLAADLMDRMPAEERADGSSVVLVPIMTGAVVFLADLMREMPLKMRLGLVAVTSYPGKSLESKGASISSELPADLGGKHVVIVDDILDSGQTLALVRRLIAEQAPASLSACVLLEKKREHAEGVSAEYVGFTIPDEFVVGYGLDYDGQYRNYPAIATLKPERVREAGPNSPA
ncbi:MAG: phosphoribosyltransferase family protein [Planctomycetota bacterium]